MQEILERIQKMQGHVNNFMIRNDMSQKSKDDVAKEFNKTLDTIIEQTSPLTIERLVNLEKLKNE